MHEKARDISAAQTTMERRLGRAATDAEMATELDVTVRQLRIMYAETAYTAVSSLDAPRLGGNAGLHSEAGYPGAGDAFGDDIPEGLMSAVGVLSERDQVVVALYYWEGFSLAEIGQVLQVSESRVSQLHSRAARTLGHQMSINPN